MARLNDAVAGAPILASWHNTNRDRTVTPFASAAERASQWPSPPAGAVSYLADTPGVLFYYESGAWNMIGGTSTTWTTTFGGTGAALGNATVTKRWMRNGKLVTFWLHVVCGSTTVIASDQLQVVLPVVAADPGNIEQTIGTGHYHDVSAGTKYLASIYINHTTDTANDRMRFRGSAQFGTSNILADLTSSAFMPWTTGDIISVAGSYEAA